MSGPDGGDGGTAEASEGRGGSPEGAPSPAATLERRGALGILTLCDPGRRNPLSAQMRDDVLRLLDEAGRDTAIRVIVINGAGGVFCAGGDVSTMGALTRETGRARIERSQVVARAIVQASKPVIAAVEGWAAGAGLSLAACCDIVVAAEDARFVAAFGKVGLMPDLGALWALPARMGVGGARRLLMMNDQLTGKEALGLGLVDRVVPPGQALEAALREGARLAEGPPLALAAIKRVLAAYPQGLEQVLLAEADLQSGLFASEDLHEGLEAYREKRPPRFEGR